MSHPYGIDNPVSLFLIQSFVTSFSSKSYSANGLYGGILGPMRRVPQCVALSFVLLKSSSLAIRIPMKKIHVFGGKLSLLITSLQMFAHAEKTSVVVYTKFFILNLSTFQ